MSEAELTDRGLARIGTILRGKYRVDRVLGVGGMAVVYAVIHRNTKQFALKMLHAEFANRPEWNARFQREGYVANSVQHPGAVTVIDDDVAEDGSAFLVMELLEGAGVETIWEQHGCRLPPKPVLAVAHQLLDVLAAAHARSIVHRDIKPANLFITNAGALKVLDFGTARLRESSPTAADVTHGGVLLGTPAFMPPGQALGLTNEVDAQTDIWAAAATLFTLLSGAYVHEGKTAQHIAVLSSTQPARSLAVAAPGVPQDVVALVDRALAFEKKDRWPSAAAMRDAARDAYLNLFGEVVSGAALATLAFDGSPTVVTGRGEHSSPHAHAPTVRADTGSSAPHLAGMAAPKSPSQSTSWGETQESPAPRTKPKWRVLPVLIGAAALAAIAVIAYVRLVPRPHEVTSGTAVRVRERSSRGVFRRDRDSRHPRARAFERFVVPRCAGGQFGTHDARVDDGTVAAGPPTPSASAGHDTKRRTSASAADCDHRPREHSVIRPYGVRALAGWLALGLLVAARAASAQASGSADAEELFKQGRAALEAKDYPTACAKLSASLQIERAVGTLISLAECEEATARLAGARQHWQEAADLADAKNDPLRRGAYCRQRFADIDKRVPRLTIQLAAAAPKDTTFRRDDVTLGPATLGSPLPVDPGSHVVTAGAPGRADHAYRVDLGEGEARTLEVEPGPPSATGVAPVNDTGTSATATDTSASAPLAPPTANGGGGGGLRTAAYVAGGAGIVAVGVGAVFGLGAISKWSQAKTDCGTGCADGSRARGESNDASTWATVSTVGFAAGGVLIATGAVLFLLSRPSQAPPAAAHVRFTPALDARALGGSLRVDW